MYIIYGCKNKIEKKYMKKVGKWPKYTVDLIEEVKSYPKMPLVLKSDQK